MNDAAEHPEMLQIAAYVRDGTDPGGIARHLKVCGLCGTLALTFRAREREHTVEPSLYRGKAPFRSGGMGRTFTATDVRMGREVILKEPAEPSNAADAGALLRMERRLLRECRILAMIEHPAVVPIYEAGRWPDGTPFFAMRRIHGPTLGETIAEARDFARRIVLLPQFVIVVEAIAHAHARGIVHRDLTPDNLMLGQLGEPYVIDWGIATWVGRSEEECLDAQEPVDDGMTKGGVGKDPYASLEQRTGAPADKIFDVYSLGVTLHHLLGGRQPSRLPGGFLEPLPKQCPEELASIVRGATSPDPHVRFHDAGVLAGELRRYQRGMLVSAHRYTLQARFWRALKRHRAWVAVLVGGLLTAMALVAAYRLHLQAVAAEKAAHQAELAAEQAESERRSAHVRAAKAKNARDDAMRKWSEATARSRALTEELEDHRRLSGTETERLALAIEAERTAAREAMELKVAAEAAQHEAEGAAQQAWAQVRASRAAREAAEAQAEAAEQRAVAAEEAAAEAKADARLAIDRARQARLALEAALAVLESQRAKERQAPEEAPDAPSRPDPETLEEPSDAPALPEHVWEKPLPSQEAESPEESAESEPEGSTASDNPPP